MRGRSFSATFSQMENSLTLSKPETGRTTTLTCSSEGAVTTELDLGKTVRNLLELERAGFRVPAWFALTHNLFTEIVSANKVMHLLAKEIDAIHAMSKTPAEAGARCTEIIHSLKFPLPIQQEVASHWESKITEPRFVAVRASGFSGAFDGFETQMFVRDGRDLLNAVKKMWAQAFTESALVNRLSQGRNLRTIEAAFVVQQMVDVKASGLAQTASPQDEDMDQVRIQSLYGTVQGLTLGGLDHDSFNASKTTGEVKGRVVAKRHQYVLNAIQGQGLVCQAVKEEQFTHQSISNDQVSEIAKMAIQLEETLGRAQEIIFSVDHRNVVWILGSRPLLELQTCGPGAGNRIDWQRLEGIPALSRALRPLPFSVMQRAFTIGAHIYADEIQISERARASNPGILSSLLGRLSGRVYRRVEAWDTLRDFNRGPQSYLRRTQLRMQKLFHANWKEQFHKRVETFCAALETKELKHLKPMDLINQYRHFETQVFLNARPVVHNEIWLNHYERRLRRACRHWMLEKDDDLFNLLVSDKFLDAPERTEAELLIRTELGFFKEFRFKRWLFKIRHGRRVRSAFWKDAEQLLVSLSDWSLEVGRMFASKGLLDEPEDVSFLSIEEIRAFCRGTAVTTSLAGLAQLRRKEMSAEDHGTEPNARVTTYGMVYQDNSFYNPKPE